MPNIVGTKGQVVIAKEIRDKLGIGPGWITIQRAVDDYVQIVFLPPEHRQSLKGSLAPHIKTRVAPEEWRRARESGWHDAATQKHQVPDTP